MRLAPADAPPALTAHRGFAGVAPENTVRAARTAAERFGADWIELDVRPTADGTVVCFHDDALDDREDSRGITDASGLVRESSDETVLDAEVLDSGETVPRLSTVLDALPDDVGVAIELKEPGRPVEATEAMLDAEELAAHRNDWTPFVERVVAALDDRTVALASFFEGALAAAADVAPETPRVALAADATTGLTVGPRRDAAAVSLHADLLLAQPGLVERAHDAGLAVNAWTAKEWTTMRDLAAVDVDGVTVDYPGLDAALTGD